MTGPHGRDEVRRALLDAAAALFAARGAAAVSVRDIATRAGVNHGLVHRHFGSKEALRRAVMDELSAQIAERTASAPAPAPGTIPSAFTATAEASHYWRMLARALLDGEDPKRIQGREFPVVKLLLEQVCDARDRGMLPASSDPRVITALSVALGLGWLLFEPFVLAATGLGKSSKAHVRQQVFDFWLNIARGEGSA